MDKTRAELDLTLAQLSARPYIELLQRKVMPTWLLNDEDLTVECKWEKSFEFGLTQAARIILYRLENMKLKVEIPRIAGTLWTLGTFFAKTTRSISITLEALWGGLFPL